MSYPEVKPSTPLVVGLSEARAHFSEYVRRVCDGEEIVVTWNRLPVARIVAYNVADAEAKRSAS